MKFAPISDRLTGLGAAKWAVHSESLRRAALGQSIIILSIGEPDLPPPAKVLDQAADSMRSGRTRYAAGQGEPEAACTKSGTAQTCNHGAAPEK